MTTTHQTLVDHAASVHLAVVALFQQLSEQAHSGMPAERLQLGMEAAVTILRAHHRFEEDILIPFVEDKGLEGPWRRVETEHEALMSHLTSLERGADPGVHIDAILELLPAHFALEDETLTLDTWRELVSEDEARAFGKRVAAFHREALQPTAKLLPLLLYNLDPTARARFTDRMPRFVVDGLVPVVFRPQWRALRPFMAHAPARWTPGPLRGLRG